jgi:GWxTD domain-containing protein
VSVRRQRVILTLFLLLGLGRTSGSPALWASSQDDLYQQGAIRRDSGDWQAALELWAQARDSLADRPDPRIGIAYIQLATEKQATEFYDEASKIYFWGLSRDRFEKSDRLLMEDVQRISPLLSLQTREEWDGLLEKGQASLLEKIRAFWVTKDPIPTTDLNERLIEHWERLAHVKENFTLESNSIFGADDRGLVFMKYGAPEAKFGGKLGSDQLEIMRWFDDFALRQEIQRFNAAPECEIWAYGGLANGESTIFIFGKKAGFGKYGLRYGVEELITDRAFRRGSTKTTRGVLPGAMLQLMYYRDLIQVDRHFLERYRELETLWANARASGRLAPDYDFIRGKVSDYKSRDLDNIRFKYLPRDRTAAVEGLESIELKYKMFRYLDNENSARFSLMAVSSDEGTHGLDYTPFFRQVRRSKYKVRHVLVAYDDQWHIVDRVVDYPALKNTNTSTFSIAQESERAYALVSEKVFFESRRTQLEEWDIPDTAKVVGVGSKFVGKIVPLSTDSTEFEVSDLLLGTASGLPAELYPFPVIPKDPVTSSQPLLAYIELYPPTIGSEHGAEFRMEYEIKKIEKGKAKNKKKRSLENVRPQAGNKLAKTFEIELQDLQAGDYKCILLISSSGQRAQKQRTSYFKIID